MGVQAGQEQVCSESLPIYTHTAVGAEGALLDEPGLELDFRGSSAERCAGDAADCADNHVVALDAVAAVRACHCGVVRD